uniref:Uncharacterized protein n=1 Tax=Anguilla anguilla TaxID=7936 RepID=A0A0E9V516_ANGAN
MNVPTKSVVSRAITAIKSYCFPSFVKYLATKSALKCDYAKVASF